MTKSQKKAVDEAKRQAAVACSAWLGIIEL